MGRGRVLSDFAPEASTRGSQSAGRQELTIFGRVTAVGRQHPAHPGCNLLGDKGAEGDGHYLRMAVEMPLWGVPVLIRRS